MKIRPLLSGGCFLLVAGSSMATNNLSQIPLFIQQGVEPNIILTIDDSNSMRRAYDEFVMSGNQDRKRIYLASNRNPLYFNPDVNYAVPLQNNGQPMSTSFSAALLNGFRSDQGTTDLRSGYLPTARYDSTGGMHRRARSTSNSGPFESTRAYYYTWNATRPGCDGDLLTNACYDRTTVSSAQEQNFANWYSFHRTRLLTAQTAANRAFHSLPESVRVGFQSFECGGFSGNCRDSQTNNLVENRLQNFSGNHRNRLFDWLGNLTASFAGTPLRTAAERAGEYYRNQTGSSSPYAFSPFVQETPVYSCRRNYHVALTDGLWTGNKNTLQNLDTRNATLPDGMSYTPRAPYRDSQLVLPSSSFQDGEDSLADIAFRYWSSDLASSIDNNLQPVINIENSDSATQYWQPQNNPASWQHMVNFFVGFGLQNLLTNPAYDGSTFTGGFEQLMSGTAQWPLPASIGGENWDEFRAYDLWHAAVNSRGEFFSTSNSTELEVAFGDIVERITEQSYSAAAAGFDSALSGGLTRSFITSFDSADWSGDVRAYRTSNNQLLWSASQQLTQLDAGSRNIKFARSGALVDFKWSQLNTAERNQFNLNAFSVVDSLGQQRLNWSRGDRSREGSGGLRTRSGVLGDIVNSSAVFVGAPDLFGLGDSYVSFAAANASRDQRVYVAANDGMLHAFDAATGNETFAFIPSAIFSQLPRLSDMGYNHRFLLDVTPVVQDVYFDDAWHTVLIGGMRGGQALYALDITDPDNISLLWEFSDVNDADLGFTWQQPQVAMLANGEWGVVLANGYGNTTADSNVSTTGDASLLVLSVEDGSVLKKFATTAGTVDQPNSLSEPSLVDVDGDFIVDYVYSGDLLGNVWRFDLINPGASPAFGSSAPLEWQTGLGGSPLFVAKDSSDNPQPITSRLSIVRHPVSDGHLVLFGTGRYLQQGDALADTNRVQSFYAVWDWQTDGTTSVAAKNGDNQPIARSNLKARTLSGQINQASFGSTSPGGSGVTRNYDVRTSNLGAISWLDTAGDREQLGWYMDLLDGNTARGELQVSNSQVRGDLLFFTSLVPSPDRCSAAGVETWLYGLKASSGERYLQPYYDLNRDGEINQEDYLVTPSGSQVATAVKIEALLAPALVGNRVIYNGLNGTSQVLFEDGSLLKGRQTWLRVE